MKFFKSIASIGSDPRDDEGTRLQKSLLVICSFPFMLAGAGWGLLYILFDEPTAGLIPLSYSLFSALSLAFFAITRKFVIFRFTQLLLILILPWSLMMALGGFINGSAVIMWGLICPLGALLFDKPSRALYWFVAYLGLISISGLMQSKFPLENNLTPGVRTMFFVINLMAVGALIFLMVYYFVREKNFFQARSESLLLNILPAEVTRELTQTGSVKPARFDEVTILFSDFKEFTNIVATIPIHKLVHELNEIFGKFDDIMEEEGVEKIQTVGDAYLAACGLPRQVDDHALRCTRAAKKMIAFMDQRNETSAIKWKIRIGLHSGPAAAGVIGKKKFAYSIFGDTINTASRLESASEEGRINVSAYTYDLIKDQFPGEYRGKIGAKGKGDLDMYFV